jgi:pimeloyl-ACP methyl ester carboxylesterase
MIDFNAFHYKIFRNDIVLSVVIDMKHDTDEKNSLRDKISLSKQEGSKLVVTDSEFCDSLCKKNVAILCHGLLSSKNCTTLLTFSECLLVNVPFLHAVLRLDFHGNGESSGFNQWSYGGYDAEVEDLHAVVQAVQSARGTVSLMLGHSRAATVVLLYGAKHDVVPRIVSVAGRVDMSQTNTSLLSQQQLLLLDKGETVEIKDFEKKNRLVKLLNAL